MNFTYVHSLIRSVRKFLRPIKRICVCGWENYLVVPYVRYNYRRLTVRFRNTKIDKIRIVFLLNELPKWKLQGVLDLLHEDNRFNPIVALTMADIDWRQPTEVVVGKHKALKAYFARYGVSCVELADIKNKKVRSPKELSPHVVFYQQPWAYSVKQHPAMVSRYALTCYVPYYVPNTEALWFDCRDLFQRTIYRYYSLNQKWVCGYESYMPEWKRAGTYVPAGHPMLDVFHTFDVSHSGHIGVIYAPHWSITYPGFLSSEHYSTFLSNGKEILSFAKQHPEINWVFKPHPNLASALVNSGAWSECEVAAYYDAWREIGKVCLDGDYVEYFAESYAMITDCGSFLIEYAATGRPLVRLISSQCRMEVPAWNRDLFNSYYNCHDMGELNEILETVIILRQDPKESERQQAARECGIMDSQASSAIVADIKALFR